MAPAGSEFGLAQAKRLLVARSSRHCWAFPAQPLKETSLYSWNGGNAGLILTIQTCHAEAVVEGLEAHSLACVEPHRASLERYARRLSRNTSDAEDLVQDTFARALKNADKIPEEGVGPWLMVILHRLFIDQCRRRKAETKAYEGIRHISPKHADHAPKELPKWMMVTDGDVNAAVAALPEPLRRPYLMRARGDSYKAISETLELSINTVSTRIRRARVALKEKLSGEATS